MFKLYDTIRIMIFKLLNFIAFKSKLSGSNIYNIDEIIKFIIDISNGNMKENPVTLKIIINQIKININIYIFDCKQIL